MMGLEYILRIYNISQQQLAEELGIKQQNIDKWVRGIKKIPVKHLPKLSEIFKIPQEYFQKELTNLDKVELSRMQILNSPELREYESTNTDNNRTKINQTILVNEDIDIDGLRLNDIAMKKLYLKKDIDKAIDTNMNKQSPYIFGDKIYRGEYVVDLYKDFNELIMNGDVRLDIIKDIINGMRDLKKDSNKTQIKRSTYTKKITREVRKEQIKREEKDKVVI